MEYTNMITVFIIQYFQQIATCVKSKTDKSVVFSTFVLNGTVVIRIQKSTANVGFTYVVAKSRFPEPNVHVPILTHFHAFLKVALSPKSPRAVFLNSLFYSTFYFFGFLNRSGGQY